MVFVYIVLPLPSVHSVIEFVCKDLYFCENLKFKFYKPSIKFEDNLSKPHLDIIGLVKLLVTDGDMKISTSENTHTI